ncbi:hypothetical protein CYMTET_21683 [Cymbomonas tetramitiformis]|uniref:Uncharacterized protein n=1 Tax=Cymbomonas tetramitiformis TaxID=36881 RepID=A0AAE0G2C3_9CHLO|nr:hypothetical protein CYMTET_21683 [Cymbomonas tetramitiformis]
MRQLREEYFVQAWVEERFLWALEEQVLTFSGMFGDVWMPVTLAHYFYELRDLLEVDWGDVRDWGNFLQIFPTSNFEAPYYDDEGFHWQGPGMSNNFRFRLDYIDFDDFEKRWLREYHWAWYNGFYNEHADPQWIYPSRYELCMRPACSRCRRIDMDLTRIGDEYICTALVDCRRMTRLDLN